VFYASAAAAQEAGFRPCLRCRPETAPGLGAWLREPDAFPAADASLLRAMDTLEGSRRAPSELIERSEGWRPWRAYAAQHLWASFADASPHRDLKPERAPKAKTTEPSGRATVTG
jgi:methylphosphotriester-DNA--protein-cysteine methyltransferase